MFGHHREGDAMPTCLQLDADLAALLDHGAAVVRVAKRSKVPLGRAWAAAASTNATAIAAWLDRGYNVGILLGHGSLIDIEYDDAAGRRLLEQLGLADARTPTYTSGRGEHRIFRLSDPVPCCGWRKYGGLEMRFGGKPAQSVLPPSRHPDGRWYCWTISPVDCEPATITLADLNVEAVACQ
jgi:hypothetical protein